jgi:hypothetical protein
MFSDLLEEHARLLEEKEGYLERRQAPPTTINFRLNDVVNRLTEEASARRDGGEEVREWLQREAAAGNPASADAIDLLSDDDPWWRERPAG